MLSLFAMADTSAPGRFNASLLTQAQRLELFFVPDREQPLYAFFEGQEDDACSYIGIECSADGAIAEIHWVNVLWTRAAVLHMCYMPDSVKAFVVCNARNLRGEVDLTGLPRDMKTIIATQTQLSGTLDLSRLPSTMERVQFERNKISSLQGVCGLPEGLQELIVREYGIQEEILEIGKLPSGLQPDFAQCGLKGVKLECAEDRPRVTWKI